jgi:hypothetical protein
VRESVAFWRNMDTHAKLGNIGQEPPEFISTHPSHSDRADLLNARVPAALLLREQCACAPLPRVDPRIDASTRARLAQAKLTDQLIADGRL